MKTDAHADRLVASILQTFDLEPRKSKSWRDQLADLRWVLQTDYSAKVRFHRDAGSLPLHDLERYGRILCTDFNESPMHFRRLVSRVTERSAVALRMTPYGRPGHPLRGFYHREANLRQVIWLNLRHVPTAVAATLGHEVGHLAWEEIHRDTAPGTHVFHNANYAAHLDDPRELFADAFTTIAAYPKDLARQLFSRRGWPRSLRGFRKQEEATVANVYEHLRREYAADLGSKSGLPTARRFYYIVSMIHYSKLRAAILHVERI